MTVSVVTFKAYDKQSTEAFVDKTLTQIHNVLYDICKLYVPVEIMNIEITLEFKKVQSFVNVEALKAVKELDEEARSKKLENKEPE